MATPQAVLEAKERLKAAQNANNGSAGTPPGAAPPSQPGNDGGYLPPGVAQAQAITQPAGEAEAELKKLQQSHRVLQSKYDKEIGRTNEENRGLKQQIESLNQTVATLNKTIEEMKNQASQSPPENQISAASKLNPEDFKDFDPQIINVVERLNGLIDQNDRLMVRNQELEKQLSGVQSKYDEFGKTVNSVKADSEEEKLIKFHTALDNAIPKWREINAAQWFQDWLEGEDELSGMSKDALIQYHESKRDAKRVISMIKRAMQDCNISPAEPGQDNDGETGGLNDLIMPDRGIGGSNSAGDKVVDITDADMDQARKMLRAGTLSTADFRKIHAGYIETNNRKQRAAGR